MNNQEQTIVVETTETAEKKLIKIAEQSIEQKMFDMLGIEDGNLEKAKEKITEFKKDIEDGKLSIVDFEDKEQYEKLKKYRREFVSTRTGIEAVRKELNQIPKTIKTAIDSKAKELTDLGTDIEKHLDTEVKKYEEEKDRIKKEKELEVQNRIIERRKFLIDSGFQFDGLNYTFNYVDTSTFEEEELTSTVTDTDVIGLADDIWNEQKEKINIIVCAEKERIEKKQAMQKQKEENERKQFEADKAKLDEEKKQLELQKTANAEKEKQLDEMLQKASQKIEAVPVMNVEIEVAPVNNNTSNNSVETKNIPLTIISPNEEAFEKFGDLYESLKDDLYQLTNSGSTIDRSVVGTRALDKLKSIQFLIAPILADLIDKK